MVLVRGGSSPLARGLRLPTGGSVTLDGIIPARAGFTWTMGAASWSAGDHPRSRGVYLPGTGRPRRTCGSSPLARGLRANSARSLNTCGIIPARAGFTTLWGRCAGAATDHPRSRGVYLPTVLRVSPACGSSPLARGLQVELRDDHSGAGIIPARAGFTLYCE